jgi:hypothetical protein
MNHTRFYIVSLTGDHDDVVMGLTFGDRRGERLCRSFTRAPPAAPMLVLLPPYGLDGSDVMGATCGESLRGAWYRAAAPKEGSP